MVYNVYVVGAGGTGSFLLKELARFQATFCANSEHKINVLIIDGDVVEQKNLERQCFFNDSVMDNKAEVMSENINDTFELEYRFYPHYITAVEQLEKVINETKKVYYRGNQDILIGCVDNHRCRQVCESYFNKCRDIIYIDSANEYSDGEVVFAWKKDNKVMAPVRSFYYPEVATDTSPDVVEMSCQQRNAVEPQHIVTNMKAANIILAGLCPVFAGEELKGGLCIFSAFEMHQEFHPCRRKEGV